MERQEQGQIRTDDLASGGRGEDAGRGGDSPEGQGAGAEASGGQPAGAEATGSQPTSGEGQQTAGAGTATAEEDASTPLLPDHEATDFESRWHEVQVGFVDEPQRCVQEADGLVAEVMQRLADGFARERKGLEEQWASSGEASTEDLRLALQRYRSFFNRLLRTG
jgi:hypothetical protein